MAFVDTNILLRWLLGDHKQLSLQAEKIVQTAQPNSLLVTNIVVAEIVYVLRSTGRDREQTSEALLFISRTQAFKYEKSELIMAIIVLLSETRLDFADCYLLARARREKTGLKTFDKELQRIYKES